MKEDGRMSKTIIFLGAGASKAEGAPLQAELFSSYVEAISSQPYKDNKRFKSTKRNVEEFFKTFFQKLLTIISIYCIIILVVSGCRLAAMAPALGAGYRWFESIHPDI